MRTQIHREGPMTKPSLTDEALVLAFARTEDRAALEQLVESRYPQAYRYALRALADPAAADDAAQEAFLGLIRGARRFREGSPFGPWWGAILVNAVRKQARKRANQQSREQRYARSRRLAQLAPACSLEQEEVAERVRALPDQLREPIMLHFYEGLTYRQVAGALACPEGTAASRIRRGLERLRGELAASSCAFALPLEDMLTSIGELELTPRALPPVDALLADASRVLTASLLTKAVGFALLVALLAGLSFAVVGPGALASDPWARPAEGGGGPELASALPGEDGPPAAAGDRTPAVNERTNDDGPADPGAAPAAAAAAAQPVGDPAPAGVGVRVVDPAGATVPGAEIVLQGVDPAAWERDEARPDWGAAPTRAAQTLRSDAQGRARFGSPPAGAGLAVFVRRGLDRSRPLLLDPDALPHDVEVTLHPPTHPPEGFGMLVGHVTSDGRDVTDTGLLLHWSSLHRDSEGIAPILTEHARTDAQGRFSLLLPAGTYQALDVRPLAPLEPLELRFAIASGQVLEQRLALPAGAVLRGRLRRAPGDGEPKVFVLQFHGGTVRQVFGRVEGATYTVPGLAVGWIVLMAEAEGHETQRLELDIDETGEVGGPELVFDRGLTLTGRVVTADGVPVPEAWVRLDGAWQRAGPDGRFRLNDLEARDYTVSVGAPGGRFPGAHRDHRVSLAAGNFDAGDLALPVSEPSTPDATAPLGPAAPSPATPAPSPAAPSPSPEVGRVALEVTAPEGIRVPRSAHLTWAGSGRQSVAGTVDGVFVAEDVPAGPVRLELQFVRGAATWDVLRQATVAPDETLRLIVAFPSARACGQISGALGHGRGVIHASTDGLSASAPIAADGSFALEMLPPGRYQVRTSSLNGRPSEPQIPSSAPRTVEVLAGQATRLDLR